LEWECRLYFRMLNKLEELPEEHKDLRSLFLLWLHLHSTCERFMGYQIQAGERYRMSRLPEERLLSFMSSLIESAKQELGETDEPQDGKPRE